MKTTCSTGTRADDPKDEFIRQMQDSEKVIIDSIKKDPASLKTLFVADFFCALTADIKTRSAMMEDAAARLTLVRRTMGEKSFWEKCRTEGLAGVITGFWWNFSRAKWLNKRIALVFGERIALLLTNPAHLYYFQKDGAAIGGSEYESHFDRAILAVCPSFHNEKDRYKIDAETAQIDKKDKRQRCLHAEFHADGHLRKLGVKIKDSLNGPLLELDPAPGKGTYRHEGRSGGHGFLTDETYDQGMVRGTFYSPWHDGEEYKEKKEWIPWVLECISTVKQHAEEAGGIKRKKNKK